MVQKGSGNFEVVEGGAAIVTGRIYVAEDINKECINMAPLENSSDDSEMLPLTNKDVYKELRLRGYNYKGLFRGITYANNEGMRQTTDKIRYSATSDYFKFDTHFYLFPVDRKHRSYLMGK